MSMAIAACVMDEDPDELGRVEAPLTEADCILGAVNGKVQICHETGSDTNTFVLISVATSACQKAHADHATDYVTEDGTCPPKDNGGGGHLPVCPVFVACRDACPEGTMHENNDCELPCVACEPAP